LGNIPAQELSCRLLIVVPQGASALMPRPADLTAAVRKVCEMLSGCEELTAEHRNINNADGG